jgi:hypothetical protein
MVAMRRANRRCPVCASSVVLLQDFECEAFECLGCARHWELPNPAVVAGERERAAIKADPNTGKPGRPRRVPLQTAS